MKLITLGVFELIESSIDDDLQSGRQFWGEVGLAPFHDFDDDISDKIKNELEEIDQALRDDSLATGYNP